MAAGSFVAGVLVRFRLISPGLGMAELVSGWARRRLVNEKRNPSPITPASKDLPLYKDVKMVISRSMKINSTKIVAEPANRFMDRRRENSKLM
jgi:hypothetical protein